MTLKERISEDMKAAMRARESARLGAIRLLHPPERRLQVAFGIDQEVGGNHHRLAFLDPLQHLHKLPTPLAELDRTRFEATFGELDEAVRRIDDALALDRAPVRATAERRFGVERMVDEYLEVYRQILAGS